ncbi:MAG: SDR family NAD(P)-dependent oxidoreductase [Bacteroidetes bacterium]|jgi:short-subunit dehydrogenase|nr:SDR family NAD(P)-dependent oxidoreductase [Bacteroidota bacterium]
MNFTAVITGASKGIGFSVARRLAEAGFSLFIVGRDNNRLSDAKAQLLSAGAPEVYAFSGDLSQSDVAKRCTTAIFETWSSLTVLVNNAGVFLPGAMMEEEEGQFETLMTTNMNSAYHITKGLWPLLKLSNRAHVFNMCSIASITAYAAGGSYSVSKFAMLGFSKSLRLEGIPHDIRVTAILPGATLTDSWAGVDLPSTRFIEPADVANALYSAFLINENTVMEEVVLRPILGDI